MNEKTKNLLKAILAAALSLTVYKLSRYPLAGIQDEFLFDFLRELVFGVAALLSAVILKKTSIYRSDPALLKKGWTSGLLLLVFYVFQLVMLVVERSRYSVGATDLVFFALEMFLIGFAEETLFRGLIQNAFHELFGEDTVGHVRLAIICSGILFGLAHLVNGLNPEIGFTNAAMQALGVCGMGVVFCAVYYRTGKCLWYLIVLHALNDAVVEASSGRFSGMDQSTVIATTSGESPLRTLITGVLFFAFALFLLRRKKVEPLLN